MCTYVVCASESLLDSIQKHIKILLVSFSAATAATNIKAGRRKICPKREFTIPFLSPALSYFANIHVPEVVEPFVLADSRTVAQRNTIVNSEEA